MKELGTKMNGREATSKKLKIVKEQWLDKFHCKKVKLEKYLEKRNQKKHYVLARPKILFPTLEAVEKREGDMPEMQRFVEIWGGIWEQIEPMQNLLWMEKVKAKLAERANLVSEFAITDENMKKEIPKR